MRRFFVALLLALAPAPAAFAANPVFDSVGIKVPGGANVVTIQGGTGGSTLIVRLPLTTGASGQPLLSGGAANPWQWGTVSGNTTEFGTVSGALTSGHLAAFDAGGNIVDGGAPFSGTVTANFVFAGPTSGAAAAPAFRALLAADLPVDVTYLDVAQSFTKGQAVTPATVSISTSTFTPDFSASNSYSVTLVHASCPCTIANPTNIKQGQGFNIRVIQSATGSDTVTWGNAYKWAGNSAPVLSTAANAVDVMSGIAWDSSTLYTSLVGAAFQ